MYRNPLPVAWCPSDLDPGPLCHLVQNLRKVRVLRADAQASLVPFDFDERLCPVRSRGQRKRQQHPDYPKERSPNSRPGRGRSRRPVLQGLQFSSGNSSTVIAPWHLKPTFLSLHFADYKRLGGFATLTSVGPPASAVTLTNSDECQVASDELCQDIPTAISPPEGRPGVSNGV